MKVAIVTYALQVGGVESFIKLLADYFQNAGHEVAIVETLTEGLWSKTFESEGYRVIRALSQYHRSRIHHAARIAQILSNYDAVILNDAPYAQAVLGLLPDDTVAIPVLHSNLTSMLRNATANAANWDVLSVVSPTLRDMAVSFGGNDIIVNCIPNGIRVPSIWPKYNEAFDSDRPFNLIYIGSINHTQKGVFYLPRVFSSILAKHRNIRFDIVGSGPDLSSLKERFATHGVSSCFFHGMLSNAEAMGLLKQADVLIMPSHFEGLPIVLLEAIAYGVVPVVSLIPGITDFVVTDGVDGLTVSIGNEDDFAEAILNLIRDHDRLRVMSNAAWENARNRFSYEVMGRMYLELVKTSREQRSATASKRSRSLEISLLGELPSLPIFIVRPVRKVLRMLGLFSEPVQEPLLFKQHH